MNDPATSSLNKLYPDARTALAGIVRDGMLLAIGGFGLCGIPEALIPPCAIPAHATSPSPATTPASTTAASASCSQTRQVKKMISSYVGENAEFERQFLPANSK